MSGSERPIAFFDLKSQAARIRADVEARLKAVLDHGAYINGPEIAELEDALLRRSGAREVVAVSSGTDALVIALMAKGVGPGDAVFVPAFTYNATANAVLLTGATPVFVDIEAGSFDMCPDDLKRRIAALRAGRPDLRPRAIMPVDLYGLPADYPAIERIARAQGLVVIADAAQSFGGAVDDTQVGALASLTGTSFFPTKTLGGYGDGGAIFSTEPGLGEVLRSIRWHGTDEARRESIRVGMNGRLDSFQAAVLLAKLAIFSQEHARRVALAARYDANLSNSVELPARPAGRTSGWGLYTIEVENRDGVRARLSEAGVPTSVYYSQILPEMRAFRAYAGDGDFPAARHASARVLSLPFHPYLEDGEVDRVCEALRAAL